MFTNFADNTSRSLAVTAITGYQKFISPHKGFVCAHRVLYGCESCSQYFKRVIAEEGVFTAIANAKGRFQECRDASEILKQRRQKCQRQKQYQSIRLESGSLGTGYKLRDHVLSINANGDHSDQEDQEDQDNPTNPEGNPEGKQSIGGAQWNNNRNRRSPNNQIDQSNPNNNCNYCNDLADCGNCADIIADVCHGSNYGDRCGNPLEGAECPELSCPELSCGDADCLSGLDCGALDCGGCG